jgi:hypothetical protein
VYSSLSLFSPFPRRCVAARAGAMGTGGGGAPRLPREGGPGVSGILQPHRGRTNPRARRRRRPSQSLIFEEELAVCVLFSSYTLFRVRQRPRASGAPDTRSQSPSGPTHGDGEELFQFRSGVKRSDPARWSVRADPFHMHCK